MAYPPGLVENPSLEKIPESLAEELRQMTLAAEGEVFEHGMDSVYSLGLESYIEKYQGLAIRTISNALVRGSVDKVVAMETLRQLGLSEHEPTYAGRLNLLLQHLGSDLTMIRYGAMYGLSYMDDPDVIPNVEWAFERETDPYLLNFMKVVLDQLHDTETGI